MNPTYQQVWDDWKTLDADDFVHPADVRIITNEKDAGVDDLPAEYIEPNRLVRLFPKRWFLHVFLYAWQILRAADEKTVIIFNGSSGFGWLFAGYINRLFKRRRVMVLRDGFFEYHLGKERRFWFFPFVKFKTEWKIALARGGLLGYDSVSVWSKKQVVPHAEMFSLPIDRFVAIVYKANHSKRWRMRRRHRRELVGERGRGFTTP
jgi:hypothetical protein